MYKFILTTLAGFLVCGALSAQSVFLDPSFGTGGISKPAALTGEFYPGVKMMLQPDGKILVREDRRLDINALRSTVMLHRFLANGALDENFGQGGTVTLASNVATHGISKGGLIQLLPNGKILTAFAVNDYPDSVVTSLVRLNPDGSYDSSFGTNGWAKIHEILPQFDFSPIMDEILLQSNGRIVVVYGSYDDFGFRLLTPAGSIIPGYEEINWWVTEPQEEFFSDAILQPDDKILVGGFLNPTTGNGADINFVLERFNTFTFNDEDFGNNGMVETDCSQGGDYLYDLMLRPDGRIISAGGDYGPNVLLASHLSNGAIDPDFGINGIKLYPALLDPYAFDLGSDGRLVIAGEKYNVPYKPKNDGAVARIMPNGDLDTTFGVGGRAFLPFGETGFYSKFQDVKVMPDRRIVAVGMAYNNTKDVLLVRYLPEQDAVVWYRDADGDGFGTAQDSVYTNAPLAGYAPNDEDCNDQNAAVYPGAPEICDNDLDDNCNGTTDEDIQLPTAVCVDTVTLVLDDTGLVTLPVEQADAGSFDNCGIANIQLSQSQFSIANLGYNEVLLVAEDAASNFNTCFVTVHVVSSVSGVSVPSDALQVSLTPNPISGSLFCRMDGVMGSKQITLFNTSGQVIRQANTVEQEMRFNLDEEPSGMYYLRVQTGSQVVLRKLVVQH